MTRNIPKLRFKGFTDAWVQRKLSDMVYSVDTGKSKFDKEGASGEYPILGSTSVIGYDDGYDYEGDFILTARVGANAGSLYRHTGKVKISDNTVFIQTLQNIEFIYYLLTQFDIKTLSFGTGQPLVKASELKNLELLVPTDMVEQMRIGEYFRNLDNLITLCQRRYSKLQNLKKAYLSEMFPLPGEKVPRRRFQGFTGDWEQRKLGEITSKIGSGKTPSGGAAAYVDAGTPLIRSQNVHDDMVDLSDVVFIDDATNASMENSIVSANDVLLNITGASIGRSAVYKATEQANVNQHVCIIRPIHGYNSDFVQLHISSNNGQKQIDSSQAGGAREGLNFEQIGKFEFAFPSYEEQVKIGDYIRGLDDLIALTQRKLEKLQSLKKAYLSEMFPQ